MNQLLKTVFNFLPSSIQGRVRQSLARAQHKNDVSQVLSIRDAITVLEEQHGPLSSDCQEDPVFILSAGWRSGSTLLQRLICSDPSFLIWGEPYQKMSVVQKMSESLRATDNKYPAKQHFSENMEMGKLSSSWIANLQAAPNYLLDAHRNFFISLWAKPAHDLGFSSWGIKEVRLTADHAWYLKWLFPRAKIIFLVRNPLHAWKSYRVASDFYFQWPEKQITNAQQFGRLWSDMVSGYMEIHEELGSLFIRLEDLVTQEGVLSSIAEYTKTNIDRGVLTEKIGGSFPAKIDVPELERKMLHREVYAIASLLGYET